MSRNCIKIGKYNISINVTCDNTFVSKVRKIHKFNGGPISKKLKNKCSCK